MKKYELLRSVLELINLCESIEEVKDLTECILNETKEFVPTPANEHADELQSKSSSNAIHRLAV